MSTPVCVSCQESLSCSDSPLSVTGNIIGILTFASALMISAQVYLNSMRNAEGNMTETMSTLQSKYADFQRLALKLQTEMVQGHVDDPLKHRVTATLRGAYDSLGQTKELLRLVKPGLYHAGYRFWLRAKFIQREELIKSAMAKTETGMTMLREIANDVFSSVALEPTEDEVLFRSKVMRILTDLKFPISRIYVEERRPARIWRDSQPDEGFQALKLISEYPSANISSPIPEPTEHEVAFRGEVLQDLIEVRNEMRNLKDTNARVLREMQDMLRGALSKPVPPIQE